MLIGLSPNRLALSSTLLATVLAGGLGVLAASIVQLDPTALPLQVVPALTAALFARFTSFWIAALVGLAIGMLESILYYLQIQSWFPTDNGVAHAGHPAAARVRADGRRDVRARHEPAESRRARRAAASARAASEAALAAGAARRRRRPSWR